MKETTREMSVTASHPGRSFKGGPFTEWFAAFVLFMITVPVMYPWTWGAHRPSNEASAIGALRSLTTAQAIFREADKDGDGDHDYGTLRELGEAHLIDKALASGTRQGYVFSAHPLGSGEDQYFVTAWPLSQEEGGDRFFYINETGVIYSSSDVPITNNGENTDPLSGTALGTK